jgi:prepilin-type N-terminal cleavage/methylation domain-containing protein
MRVRTGLLRTWTRRLHRREDGMTLVEVIIATSLLGIVSLVFTSTLASIQNAVVSEDVRTQLNDQARLALADIDRQVRSGNLLYNPGTETGTVDPFGVSATGYMFRVYTQVKFNDSDDPRCSLWVIDEQGQLQYRWWPVLDPDSATDWRVVATGIVNRSVGTPAFVLDSTGRTVTVTLRANADYAHDPTATQTFKQSLTGRNTSFGYPNDVCSELPSDM